MWWGIGNPLTLFSIRCLIGKPKKSHLTKNQLDTQDPIEKLQNQILECNTQHSSDLESVAYRIIVATKSSETNTLLA